MADSRPRAVRVRVPGSTSNLGPGFDALGMAVDLALEAAWEPGPPPLDLVRTGTLADVEHPPESDLAVRALRRGLGDAVKVGGRLVLHSEVPVARGLGSSAAAVVAGELLARGASGPGADPRGWRHEVLEAAVTAEGHPDNAAPALWGGLVAVAPGPTGPVVAPLPLSPGVGFAFAEPGVPVHTREAREALPTRVPHALAARTAARLGVLLHGLATADGGLVRAGLDDELHVPWRLPLIPSAAAVVAAGIEAGAWGVTISGSGSGLLALGPPSRMRAVAEAMADAWRKAGRPDGRARVLRPDTRGARVLDP